MVNNYGYNKSNRLKSKKAIEALFSGGKSVQSSNFKAFYCINQEKGLRMGVSVPKRNIKLAVTRNLIKRRIREAYRLNNEALKLQVEKMNIGMDVMFVYNSQQILEYQKVEEKIKVILTRLIESSELDGE